MTGSSPRRPERERPPSPPPRVGRASEFVGTRLVLLGLLARLLGWGLLAFAGYEVWAVVTRGSFGAHVVPLVVGGSLAVALLSIGRSASSAGLKYLRGENSLARDLGRFVGRRIQRRHPPLDG